MRKMSGKVREVVKLLLRNPKRSFQDVAREVGLTRERVRQIAKDRMGLTARKRIAEEVEQRAIQRLMNQQKLWEKNAFYNEATKRGLHIFGVGFGTFMVNGKLTYYRQTGMTKDGCYRLRKPWTEGDVVVTEVKGKGWMMIPYDEMPEGTMFRFSPKMTKLPYTLRHDWPRYLNNWSVFDNGPSGSVEKKRNRVQGESVSR